MAWLFSPKGSEEPPTLVTHRADGRQAALVLLHGFGGDARKTWGEFPRFLIEEPSLSEWDVYSLGYTTDLRVDVRGIWSANPDLGKLATLLSTHTSLGGLSGARVLSFLAHSMGGLVVQRALVDDPKLAGRTRHVILFGTPSLGLRKAGLASLLNLQAGDMQAGGRFIKELRERWTTRFGDASPFELLVVAGDRDEFVPGESSLSPFPQDKWAVVYGNHLEIVKPLSSDALSVQVVVRFIAGEAAPAGPWNAARVAVERHDFQRAIDRLWDHRLELDEDNLVNLALALESVGRQADAIELLTAKRGSGTDALGVLAGRLKRRWLAEGREADAVSAEELYRQGFERAAAAAEGLYREGPEPVKAKRFAAQAFYHAINQAFLALAFRKDLGQAQRFALKALSYCRAAPEDLWNLATQGEAALVLGQPEEALVRYRQALAKNPMPRQVESIYQQATRTALLLDDAGTAKRLDDLFRSVGG